MLEVNQLSYSIGSKKILQDLSFQVSRGEFVGLLGPNGSGKTTLLRILSGVYRDYSGRASLNLLHINKLSPRGLAQTVAVVPQEVHFAFPYTALEIVLMGRHPYLTRFAFESETDHQIARVAMEKTDCWQFAGRRIDTLSGGEKQRVLLARALAQKPKLLLLDEPSTHMDLAHQQSLFGLLREINRGDCVTILCVVHDINWASLYCEKVILLKEGRLNHFGLKRDVLTRDHVEDVFGVSLTAIPLAENTCFFPRRFE